MNDPGQNAPVIHPRLASRPSRQHRFNPGPLRIRKPKEIRHHNASLPEPLNHPLPALKTLFIGPDLTKVRPASGVRKAEYEVPKASNRPTPSHVSMRGGVIKA